MLKTAERTLLTPDRANRMLKDPPELWEYASRGDPPISRWPGQPVTREILMASSGDPRDWFRYGHRLEAYRQVWAEFVDARRRRRNFMSGFQWNQVLILGEYGVGKTVLAILAALEDFRRGHPAFFNSSGLFGWRMTTDEAFTALGFGPKSASYVFDESSAQFASRVGHGVAITSASEMNLNTRKQNAKVYYMSAHDWEIAPSIRRECKEVWMPVPKDELVVDLGPDSESGKPRLRPANDPDNFRIAYHVWDGYPYKKANIIEGQNATDRDGFGPPTYTVYDEGENVRLAFLLNDTFELAAAGAATLADRNDIKQNLQAFRDGTGPVRGGNGNAARPTEHQERTEKVLLYLQSREDEPNRPQHFSPGEIAAATGISVTIVGRVMQELIPGLRNEQRKGYSTEMIYNFLDELYESIRG